jgi:hypothetical protein
MPIHHYKITDLKQQLSCLRDVIFPDAKRSPSAKPPQPTNTSDAYTFCQFFYSSPSASHAVYLRESMQHTALEFLVFAKELLEDYPDEKSVPIDISSSQQNMEFAGLCVFVHTRLSKLLGQTEDKKS